MTLLLSPRTLGRDVGSSARKTPGPIVLSVVVLATVTIYAVISSILVPGMLGQNLALGANPAGAPGRLLGADKIGHDVLTLTVADACSTIVGPIVIAVGSMVAGLIVGISTAWRGGLWDACVFRSCGVLLSLPVTLLAIVVVDVIGGSYWVTVSVLIMLFASSDVRMIHATTLAQKPQPYIEAARVLGLSGSRTLTVHILPNIAPIVWASLFVNIVFALVSLSGLSYLGLGVGTQDANWGRQLADGQALLTQNPAASVAVDLTIIVTATAINIAGDWFVGRKKRDLWTPWRHVKPEAASWSRT